jgi:hypothetical protein
MQSRFMRVESAIVGAFGLVLIVVILSTFFFEGQGSSSRKRDPAEVIDVAVLYLHRSEWRIFAHGLKLCIQTQPQLGRLIEENDESLLIETAKSQRPVRFTYHVVRGQSQTRDVVKQLLQLPHVPVAVVGSSNTGLTEALADELKASEKPDKSGPLLLVPWATSVALLDRYPGRTFRFCANNRRVAEMLVACLKSQFGSGKQGPDRVVMMIDPIDPYSVDLASCFHKVMEDAFPKTTIVDWDESSKQAPRLTGGVSEPTLDEQARARSLWAKYLIGSTSETWVFLPLQNGPARRMIAAINGASPGSRGESGKNLKVICGDAIGESTLRAFSGQLSFPVWSVTTNTDPFGSQGLEEDVQEQAEIVAAVLLGLDEKTPATTHVNQLRHYLVKGEKQVRPFGRSLDFSETGEPQEFDPGGILQLVSETGKLLFYRSGQWNNPQTVEPKEVQ